MRLIEADGLRPNSLIGASLLCTMPATAVVVRSVAPN
jgi:hypothetical protein